MQTASKQAAGSGCDVSLADHTVSPRTTFAGHPSVSSLRGDSIHSTKSPIRSTKSLMTKADRNKRYNEKHADTLALKRKRVQEERSEEQRHEGRAADRERKRRKKASQTPTEKAAQHQKDAESYR